MTVLSIPALAAALEETASHLKAARGQEQLNKQLVRAASEFSVIADELNPISNFIQECISCGITTKFPKPPAALLQRLNELCQLTQTDPQAFINADDLTSVRMQLDRLKVNWQSEACTAWSEFCRTHIPTRDEAILSFLAETGNNSDTVEEINRLDSLLAQLANRPPIMSVGGASMLIRTIEKRRSLWASIDVGQVPPEAMAFINSASQSGASLSDYSPEVAAWLKDRDLLDSYVIISRSGRE